MKKIISSTLVLLLLFAIPVINFSKNPEEIEIPYGQTPTIAGPVSQGEWEDAYRLDVISPWISSRMMHDCVNIYILIQVNGNIEEFYFASDSNQNNKNFDAGDDIVRCFDTCSDWRYISDGQFIKDVEQNITGFRTYAKEKDVTTYMVQIPKNSMDKEGYDPYFDTLEFLLVTLGIVRDGKEHMIAVSIKPAVPLEPSPALTLFSLPIPNWLVYVLVGIILMLILIFCLIVPIGGKKKKVPVKPISELARMPPTFGSPYISDKEKRYIFYKRRKYRTIKTSRSWIKKGVTYPYPLYLKNGKMKLIKLGDALWFADRLAIDMWKLRMKGYKRDLKKFVAEWNKKYDEQRRDLTRQIDETKKLGKQGLPKLKELIAKLEKLDKQINKFELEQRRKAAELIKQQEKKRKEKEQKARKFVSDEGDLLVKTTLDYLNQPISGLAGKKSGLGLGKRRKDVTDALKPHLKTWSSKKNKDIDDLCNLIGGILSTFSKIHPKWNSGTQRRAMQRFINSKRLDNLKDYRDNLTKLYRVLYSK